jgi:lipopolysaccharide biosynthesis glycosyltransferase
MTRGVVIVGLGLYRKWAESLPQRLRSFGIKAPCTVVTEPIPGSNVQPAHSWGVTEACARWHKTHLYDITPYDETLLLDADILPVGDLSYIWSHLENSDVAACVEEVCPWMDGAQFKDDRERRDTEALMGPLGSAYHFNAGVILFRKTHSTRGFFEQWQTEWRGAADQPALNRAMFRLGIDVAILPPPYNRMPPKGATMASIKKLIPTSILIHFWAHKPILWDWK